MCIYYNYIPNGVKNTSFRSYMYMYFPNLTWTPQDNESHIFHHLKRGAYDYCSQDTFLDLNRVRTRSSTAVKSYFNP